jgi:2'-hydroxyisoflavone reductase
MKLLVLGGTRFLGRHLVELALERGHELTLFNRGRTAPGLFAAVEQLFGDRDGDLAPLLGRQWDAIFDTCGYLPRVVRKSARALGDAAQRYLFVSSISVYADGAAIGQGEDAPRAKLLSPECEDIAGHYGALKAACEDEVVSSWDDRAVLVRPGLIVGPFDPSGRFTYWAQRLARGGDVLAPPDPDYPVQCIDARDLAAWMLDLVERGGRGAYNASGPASPISFAGFLAQCAQALGAQVRFVWPSADFLAERGVKPWTELPLYAGEDGRGACAVDLRRALASGLRVRPLGQTCADTSRWAGSTPLPAGIGLPPQREAELLRDWQHREKHGPAGFRG